MNSSIRREPDTEPIWKEHFPISSEDDAFVTRREFTKSLGLASLAAFVSSAALGILNALRGSGDRRYPAVRIADLDELAVGASLIFYYPEPKNPCVLVRIDENRYAAYSQKCTHLGCPVVYERKSGRLNCPCHVGCFSVDDGRPLFGPPRRPLPRIELQQKGGELWTTGNILA